MTSRVLIVDDDESLRSVLTQFLEREGYSVCTAATGPDALRTFYRERPQAVLLDLMLPGMDGWEVCARLRELSDVPILMLSARTAQTDKLRGFRLGVDDYISKPFSLAELAARLQAVLTRSERTRREPRTTWAWQDLAVDVDRRQVRRAGQVLELTPTEFRLLLALIQRQGALVSEDELREELWGRERTVDSSALRRYIWLLRRKLEEDPAHPRRVVAVRGQGYRLGTGPLSPPAPTSADDQDADTPAHTKV
jgi:DNA-binding response OmpR family regulator